MSKEQTPTQKAILEAVDYTLMDRAVYYKPNRKPGEMFKALPKNIQEELKNLKSEDMEDIHRFFLEEGKMNHNDTK